MPALSSSLGALHGDGRTQLAPPAGIEAHAGRRQPAVRLRRVRLIDAALVAGAATRLTRLVVSDDAGEPIRETVRRIAALPPSGDWLVAADDGLACPYCVAVWTSGIVVTSYAAWGQRGWWRVLAGALATSYAAGHAVAHLDEG